MAIRAGRTLAECIDHRCAPCSCSRLL